MQLMFHPLQRLAVALAALSLLAAGCSQGPVLADPPLPTPLPTLTSLVLPETGGTPSSAPPPSHTPTPSRTSTLAPTATLTPTITLTPTPTPPALPGLNELPYLSLSAIGRMQRLGSLQVSESAASAQTPGPYALSRDGRWLAVITSSPNGALLRLFDLQNGREGAIRTGAPSELALALAFHPDSRRLAAANQAGELWLWNITNEDGVVRAEPEKLYEEAGLTRLAQLLFTPNGSRLIGLAERPAPDGETGLGELLVWDTNTGQLLERAPAGGVNSSLLVSPNGSLALQAGTDGTLRFWEAASGRAMGQQILYTCPSSLVGAAFSPDNQVLAVQCNGDLSRIYLYQPNYWRPEALRLLTTLDTGAAGPGQLAFNRDGALLAAAAGYPPRQVTLWDLIRRQPAGQLANFSGDITRLSIHLDGRLLVIQLNNGTIEFWGVPRGS